MALKTVRSTSISMKGTFKIHSVAVFEQAYHASRFVDPQSHQLTCTTTRIEREPGGWSMGGSASSLYPFVHLGNGWWVST